MERKIYYCYLQKKIKTDNNQNRNVNGSEKKKNKQKYEVSKIYKNKNATILQIKL